MCLRELEAIGEQDKSIYLQIAPTGMENNELYPRYNPLDPVYNEPFEISCFR